MAGLRLVSPEQLSAQDEQANADVAAAGRAAQQVNANNLVAYIDNQFNTMVRHRDGASGWSDRLVQAMQVFNGQYSPEKLMEVRKFGGSEIYSRLIASKCRGAASLLRDIYLNADKPWGLKATPDPTLPDDVAADIAQLVQAEAMNAQRGAEMGVQAPLDENAVNDRIMQLTATAKRASIKKARIEADKAFKKLDDIFVEGGMYDALNSGLIDVTMFPFMCLKGPIVRSVPKVKWMNGTAQQVVQPVMQWNRVSPFDVWWTPGVSDIKDAAVIERSRITRADLNQVIDLPGYNRESILEVLNWYGETGYVEAMASTSDTQRAVMESREDPRMNQSGMMDMLEYHGYVQGRMLLDHGMMTVDQIEDPMLDYFVDAFKIGRYVIKVQMSPSLRKRPPYYVTSFEKVPGTVVGNALPDILADIQDATNAALRSLVNNMSIASGPQVVINDDRIAENTDGDELYPWKRWHVETDPLGSNNGQAPVSFFQPESRAQELLTVYEKFTQIADELSAIPRYITGSERTGGAGRTASGLAMLMGNSAKILQTVAANIDNDVIQPIAEELYDLVMLTDQTGMLRGDERIEVLGVAVAMQRETQRQRSLEFLQITANPIDMQIMGPKGRATVLRSVADGIGLDGEDIVPPDEEIQAMAAQGPPGATPGGPTGGPPGGPPPGGAPQQPPGAKPGGGSIKAQAPRTNTVGKTPGAGPGTGVSGGQGPG